MGEDLDCDEILQRLRHFASFNGEMTSMQKIMNPLRHTIMGLQNENNLTILRETKRENNNFKYKSAQHLFLSGDTMEFLIWHVQLGYVTTETRAARAARLLTI